jgi:hypothetical protein
VGLASQRGGGSRMWEWPSRVGPSVGVDRAQQLGGPAAHDRVDRVGQAGLVPVDVGKVESHGHDELAVGDTDDDQAVLLVEAQQVRHGDEQVCWPRDAQGRGFGRVHVDLLRT